MSLLLPFSLFLFLFFFLFISIAAQSNSTYPNCPSYNCNGLNISYPFWRMANQITTHLCGYQGFGIQCSNINGTQRPIIAFGGDSYYVQNISYEFSIIHLAIYDVSTIANVGNRCPRVRQCIDLQTLPFDFTPYNVNLSFHFNCTRIPTFATPIPCFELETRKSCVNVVSLQPEDFDWGSYSCDEGVVTTVLEINVPDLDRLGTEFGGALSRGFELSWRSAEGCGKCEESNGQCGYNRITMEFMCFCSDGRTTVDHCKTKKGTWILEKYVVSKNTSLI
ncbi:hypothetical protein L6452_15365 [Arctium lappa]|uniref:Uncharacterized protein n=1 Tax=Arctium lappa TaxID=4217 RepID=A0ACB9CNQ5_ARCLA|nr:hypothetical protein L6452_15365 [Arctium lappa]